MRARACGSSPRCALAGAKIAPSPYVAGAVGSVGSVGSDRVTPITPPAHAQVEPKLGTCATAYRAVDPPPESTPVTEPAPSADSAGCAANMRSSSKADVCTTSTSQTAFFTTLPGTDPRS
jgi:hypothetical protein